MAHADNSLLTVQVAGHVFCLKKKRPHIHEKYLYALSNSKNDLERVCESIRSTLKSGRD